MNLQPIPACDGAGAQSSAVSDCNRVGLDGVGFARPAVATGKPGCYRDRRRRVRRTSSGSVPCRAGFDSVVAASRATTTSNNPDVATVPLSDLSRTFDWQPLLDQCDAVVHLAGIAHKYAGDDFYDRVNHRATSALARAISRGEPKHLVFISSIAAQSGSYADHHLTEDDFPTPNNAYGRSKFAAEQAIRAAGVSFTILRPVVIYGEGEEGNFATVHRISRLPIPLPFGALSAQRSVLSIENFNSAVATALVNPRARGETFIVSNPSPVTVAKLIARHRASLGRSPWLVPMPESWIRACLKATGQTAVWERIGRPLVAPPTRLIAIGWEPS